MGDKKLRSDIVNLRVVAILAVIFGHSTTIYWYNWTDYRTTQEAPVFAHVGNLAMLVLGLWMLISGFCVGLRFVEKSDSRISLLKDLVVW